MTRACRLIEESDSEPSLEDLASAIGLSPAYFHRIFKAITGVTPKEYADARRTVRLQDELVSGNTVTSAIYNSGFNSTGRFYEKSSTLLGMTPSRYRAGGQGEEMRFAVGQTSLGAVLVASTDKGVTAILLGDDAEQLVRSLQDRFPRAILVGADPAYEATVARVIGLVETPSTSLGLPIDVRGTAFQKRVWKALQHIPSGTTTSYSEVARHIGMPGASRAVAQACAANNLAVAIPCHRVVRTDGALSGYAWGIDRKRTLIAREAAAAVHAVD